MQGINAYKIFIEIPQVKRLLGKPSSRREGIKMNTKK
jgi:hypothetical protein